MSKLIVEMEMPRACPCEFADSSSGIFIPCFAYYGVVERAAEFDKCVRSGGRPEWCPICGVLPDEHGDLVDADTVLWEVDDADGIYPPMPVTISDIIEAYDVPVIIKAERRDDGR